MAKAVDVAMTLKEVAARPKIARPTAYKLAQEGKLPSQKVGRQWRFHGDAVDAWIKQDTK